MMSSDKCFVIAELSANHGNDIEIAKETIRAIKRSGADAVKLQTYTADTITLDVRNKHFKIDQGTKWDGQYLYDLYKEASLPWSWHKELFSLAKELDLICFSSPFDNTAVDFLEELNTPIYKIASFEITDIPLIEYVAAKKKPIIISTGIATIEDIELAIEACKRQGNKEITILKCTSAYPALAEEADLCMIKDIEKRFNVKVGLSDHTLGVEAPIAAVSLGAKVIEKHFILDKKIGGPDAHFSLDEEEFTQMVKSIRTVEKMMGKVSYALNNKKEKSRQFSRSLFICKDVKKGEVLTKENVRSVRPSFGLHPKHLDQVIGKKFTDDFEKGVPLSFNMIR